MTPITARRRGNGQIRGKSFPSTPHMFLLHMFLLQGTAMLDSFMTISARLALFSLFVLMLALAGAGA